MSQTFPWVPSYGSQVAYKPDVRNAKFGDGYEQRLANGLNNRPRQWKVIFANRVTATADQMQAFLDARGAVESFDWTPPHGSAGKWVCREWTEQKSGPQSRSFEGVFEEVFET